MEDINNEDIAALLEEAEEEDDDDDEESEEELEPPIEDDAPAQAPAAPAQAAGSAPATDADGDQKMPPADGEAGAKKPEDAEKAEDVDSELERDLAGGMDEAVVSEVQKSASMAAEQSAAAGEEEMEDEDDDDDDESEEEEMAMDSEPEDGATAAASQGKEEGLQSAASAAAMGSGKGAPQKELKQAVAAEEAPKAAAPAALEPAAPAEAKPAVPSKADEIAAEKKALLEKQAALQASLAPLPEGEAFAAIRTVFHAQLDAVAKEIEAADAKLVAAQAEEAAAAAASKAAAAAAAASKAAAAVEAAKASAVLPAAEAKQDSAAKPAAPAAAAGSGKMDVDLVSGQTAPSPKKRPAPSPQKKPDPSPQKPDAAGLDEEMQDLMMDDEGEEEELDSELERDLAGDMDPELFAELAASDPTAKKDGAGKAAKAKKETAASSGAGTSTSSSAKPPAATTSPAATDNAKTVSSTAAAQKDEKPATKVPSLYADRISVKASPKAASRGAVPKASSIVAKPDSMPAKPPNALSLHIREQEASGKVGNRASFAALSQDELKRLNYAVQELQKKYAENMAAFLQTKDGKEYQKKLDAANQKTKLARAKEKLKALQPTKPLSAFGLFSQACKGQTGCGLPTVRWAKLTEKEKQFWEEEHKKAMAEYQKAMAAFEKSSEYKAFEKAKNATSGKHKAPPSKEEGAAKRPRLPTPFILYLKDMSGKNMDRAELNKGWSDLGPEGQKKYQDQYKAMQEQLQNAPGQPSEGKRREKDAASPKQPPKAPPPEPPVRPKSAKMLFLDSRRKEIIKEEGSSVAPGDLARRLIKDWDSLIPEQKKAWEDREKALMETYNKEMERYKQLTAPAQQPAGRASAGGKRPNQEMGQGDDQGSDSSSSSSSSSD